MGMSPAIALNAAVVAHGCTPARATFARAARSLRQPLLQLLPRPRHHLLLAHATAATHRRSMTATMRDARTRTAVNAQSAAMAAIWSPTPPRDHTAWRTRCSSRCEHIQGGNSDYCIAIRVMFFVWSVIFIWNCDAHSTVQDRSRTSGSLICESLRV